MNKQEQAHFYTLYQQHLVLGLYCLEPLYTVVLKQ